jgi:hypothetical protein
LNLAVTKQLLKRFLQKKKSNGLEPIWARETNLADPARDPGRAEKKNI